MILALDASTSIGTVALFDGGRLVAMREATMRGPAAERLMPAVVDAVEGARESVPARGTPGGRERDDAWGAIDRIIVGGGPGGFTSLRIAASIAKGLATASGAALWAVPSLALIVAQFGPGDARPGRYLAVLDALRGEAFALEVVVAPDGRLSLPGAARRLPVAGLQALAQEEGLTLIGPAGPVSMVAAPHARGALRLADAGLAAAVDLERWEPDYGRLAEAQVRWEAAHGRALGGDGR